MATIICNISALEFHRTPPAARDVQTAATALHAADSPLRAFTNRSNTAPDIATIREHLPGMLKGLSLPVHICNTEHRPCRFPTVVWHELPRLSQHDLIPIAEGLFVTTPYRTAFDLAAGRNFGTVLKLCMELCGLYTIIPKTAFLVNALEQIRQDVPIDAGKTGTLSAYHGVDGNVLPFIDADGEAFPWQPCSGLQHFETLWKRPPLCSVEGLLGYAERMDGLRGSRTLISAAEHTIPGSASPLESIVALLIGHSRRRGQEALPHFYLNRRIALPHQLAQLDSRSFLVPDISWISEETRELRHVCEVDGAQFHAGGGGYDAKRQVYRDAARRAAYEGMGISPTIITYPQVANLERWDMLLDVLYERLALKRPRPSVTFLRKRDELHRELMGTGL